MLFKKTTTYNADPRVYNNTAYLNDTQLTFLYIDKQHEAYRHEKKYYRHDMGIFLSSTCATGLFSNKHEF